MQRRILAFVLVLCMLFSTMPALAVGTDVLGHWAQEDITYLNTLRIMEGYPDGTFLPENYIKKSEFITLINRTFGLNRTASISYGDVPSTKWFYSEIQKAEAAGYMFTFSKQVRPELELTREEAAAMFGKLLGLSSTASSRFTDSASISSWALPYVTAVAEEGIISGYLDGSFKPKDTIKRAEVARIICNTIGNYYSTAGTYTDVATGNVTIVANGVTLRNMTIPGNLYITEGVGYGTVTLEDVVVEGEILTVGAPNVTLILKGEKTKANVGASITTQVASSIASLTVSGAYTTPVSIGAGATVATLTLDGVATVTGSGAITQAYINMNGSNLAMRPQSWTLSTGVGVTIDGTYTTTTGSGMDGFASGYPKATLAYSALSTTTIEIVAKTTKACNLYFAAVAAGSSQPTAQQIKSAQSSGNTVIYRRNYTTVTNPNNEVVVTLSGLSSGLNYDVWIVMEEYSTGVLGTPVKVTPAYPIFAEEPVVQTVSDTSVSVSMKLSKTATVYWAAVPKSITTVPTAQQIISQSAALTGYVYGNRQMIANYSDSILVNGLTYGASAYDLYFVTRDAAGEISPEIPEKVTIADKNSTMTVSYYPTALSGEYPSNTTVYLTFDKVMFQKNGTLPMDFIRSELLESEAYIKITQVDVATGAKTTLTAADFDVTVRSNKSLEIKPSTAWANGAVYTIEIVGLTTSDNVLPTPASIEFMTYGAGSIIARPVSSKDNNASDATVFPGEKITLTCSTPGATIFYTDPATGNFASGSGSGVTIQIPASAQAGRTYQIVARSQVGNRTSEASTYYYVVGLDAIAPKLVTSEGYTIADGLTINAGSTVYLTSSDSSADTKIYYTVSSRPDDYPSANSTPVNGNERASIVVWGEIGSKMYINAYAIKETSGEPLTSSVTFTITVGSSASGTTTNRPVFLYNDGSGTQVLDTSVPQHLRIFSDITITTLDGASTMLWYTTDDTDPRYSNTRVPVNSPYTLTLTNLNYNTTQRQVIKAVAYNQYGGYSDVVTLEVYVSYS